MKSRTYYIALLLMASVLVSCDSESVEKVSPSSQYDLTNIPSALLASRIKDLDDLAEKVDLQYFKGRKKSIPGDTLNTEVQLSLTNGAFKVESVLKKGVSQKEIMDIQEASWNEKFAFLVRYPQLISQRRELEEVYLLARRRYDLFGWGDVAFFDLAEQASQKIKSTNSAYQTARDSSEKGYLNTFNHITAQALITSCYSEDLADLVADLHERYNMPELITASFTHDQLHDPDKNAMDNYVDLVNNEIGQEIGKILKRKYKIKRSTKWPPQLLASYLNDLQLYYRRSFHVYLLPFKQTERAIQNFTVKLNSRKNFN
ncbi:MAG: hypothetical protein RIC95_13830 [Vicingaceae bacterium]